MAKLNTQNQTRLVSQTDVFVGFATFAGGTE